MPFEHRGPVVGRDDNRDVWHLVQVGRLRRFEHFPCSKGPPAWRGVCLAGGPDDRRVELDRQRPTEQLNEDLHPLGGVHVLLENGVHHP